MTILMDHRTEAVTLWRISGQDVTNKPTFDTPVTINARYQEMSSLFVDASGREITSETQIFTEDMALQIGDWILLGTHVDATPPEDAQELVKVAQYRFVTDSANVYRGIVA